MKAPAFFARNKLARGFTLFEMLVAIAVFILLCGAVFGILNGVLQSASTLRDNQNRRDEIEALNAFLTKQFRTLPNGSSLVSYRRGNADGLGQNGLIVGVSQDLIALEASRQPNGYYMLQVASFDPALMPKFTALPALIFQAAINRDNSPVVWKPIMHDIADLKWRFQTLNSTEWLELWGDPNGKPNLVELSLLMAGDKQSIVMDFWIPPLQNNAGNGPQVQIHQIPPPSGPSAGAPPSAPTSVQPSGAP